MVSFALLEALIHILKVSSLRTGGSEINESLASLR
jgi:hypothetical protein